MSVRSIEHAREMLADALWWMKGFAAGTTSDHDDTVHGLAVSLREVRIWLDRVQEGRVRKLGDEKAIVLSYAEFEQLFDGLRSKDLENRDRLIAVGVIRAILDAYRAEAEAERIANNPDIPF